MRRGSTRAVSPGAQAPRSRPDRDPHAASEPTDRGRICLLDPQVHPVPSQASPSQDGRGGGNRVPLESGGGRSRGRVHAESGAVRAALPLPVGARDRAAVARGSRARQATGPSLRRPHPRGGGHDPPTPARGEAARRRAALRQRPTPPRVPTAPGEGPPFRPPRDHRARRQWRSGSAHNVVRRPFRTPFARFVEAERDQHRRDLMADAG